MCSLPPAGLLAEPGASSIVRATGAVVSTWDDAGRVASPAGAGEAPMGAVVAPPGDVSLDGIAGRARVGAGASSEYDCRLAAGDASFSPPATGAPGTTRAIAAVPVSITAAIAAAWVPARASPPALARPGAAGCDGRATPTAPVCTVPAPAPSEFGTERGSGESATRRITVGMAGRRTSLGSERSREVMTPPGCIRSGALERSGGSARRTNRSRHI